MTRWLIALLICLAMGSAYRLGPIEDGAQVIADDLNDAISTARVAAKE